MNYVACFGINLLTLKLVSHGQRYFAQNINRAVLSKSESTIVRYSSVLE